MTTKKIKTSDILGDNYYIYELTSSNYTPALNGTITITCTMKDVYGAAAGSKLITLYQNGTSVSTQTTNSSGVATWSVTCSNAGIQSFKVGNKIIEVFVDNKSDIGHTHNQYLTSHQDITGKENINNKVSSWSSPTTNTNYPTEKLVKDSLDLKADKTTTLDTTNLSAYVENKFLILTDEEEDEMITIGCRIVWSDQNNIRKLRPLSVKCTLSDNSQYILSNINDWGIIIQVPKYDTSNEEIQYSWDIPSVVGYRTNTTVNNNIVTFTLSYSTLT